MDDDEEGVIDNNEDDLILAAADAAHEESAYNKLEMEGSAEECDSFDDAKGAIEKPAELKCWVQWYLALEDHDYMVEVDRDFITDKFNLIKLRDTCGSPPLLSKKRFKESLHLILSAKVPNEEDLQSQ